VLSCLRWGPGRRLRAGSDTARDRRRATRPDVLRHDRRDSPRVARARSGSHAVACLFLRVDIPLVTTSQVFKYSCLVISFGYRRRSARIVLLQGASARGRRRGDARRAGRVRHRIGISASRSRSCRRPVRAAGSGRAPRWAGWWLGSHITWAR
jgi:hypothetical protein